MLKRKNKENLAIILALIILFGFVPFHTYAADPNVAETDKIKPVIDYVYVENGKLKLSISDDKELSRKPIEYRINKEFRTYEIDKSDYKAEYDGSKKVGQVYEIEVEIPSTIYITVKDKADNISTYTFTIKEDNVSLSKYIPEFVLERLSENKQSKVDRFKGYKDIFELEYGKVVNALSLYEEVIKNNYNSYNKNDIKFKFTGLSSDKDGNIKLDKYGTFKVTMTHSKDKTFEEVKIVIPFLV